MFYSLLNKLEIVRLQTWLVIGIFRCTAVSRLLLAFKPVIAVLCVTRMFAESRRGFSVEVVATIVTFLKRDRF